MTIGLDFMRACQLPEPHLGKALTKLTGFDLGDLWGKLIPPLEPAYHGRGHIAALFDLYCCGVVGGFRAFNLDSCQRPDDSTGLIIPLAILTHDMGYDATRAKGVNERVAAEMAEDLLRGNVPDHVLDKVIEIIAATVTHEPTGDYIIDYFIDMDLASGLSGSRESFETTGLLIMAEVIGAYSITEDEYIGLRNAFLQRLMDRDYIYSTSVFRAYAEEHTRSNIANQLDLI